MSYPIVPIYNSVIYIERVLSDCMERQINRNSTIKCNNIISERIN